MKKRILIITTVLIFVLVVSYGEARKFYCLSNGKCVTVWKTFLNTSYIIPGKYYGIIPPSSISYIKTTNTNSLDLIWIPNKNEILINAVDRNFTIKQKLGGVQITDYNLERPYNDSVFTILDGHYAKYKNGVEHISIQVKENYATNK